MSHPATPTTNVIGAGYISAVLSASEPLIADYRRSFSSDELLDAITSPIQMVGKYLSYWSSLSGAEAGEALVAAYMRLASPNPPEGPEHS